MNNTSFEISLDTNQTKFPRGKRAELNVLDDYVGEINMLDMLAKIEPIQYPKDALKEYLGFNPSYMTEGIITKSHQEGDITIIDEFKFTGISIVEGNVEENV